MNPLIPDELHTGLVRIDAQGRISWLNSAAQDLLGRSARPGQALSRVSDMLAGWVERVRRQQRALQATEAELSDSPGQPVVDASFHQVDDDVVIELHAVAERLRQRERAERADRHQALSRLSRQLAHELRNPLAGIRAAAQLIAGQADAQTSRRHAQMVQREVDRMTRLIDGFAGDDQIRSEPVNLHQVLDEACELVLAERHGALRIQQDFDLSIPELQADGGRLHQLFLNLLRNSVQAEASQILLRSRIEYRSPLFDEPGRHAVCIDIEDDGEGVPEALRGQLFLPLVTGRHQGSGFGLAIVQQIARAHGGLVEFDPLETGSRFRLRLPLMSAGVAEHV